MESRERAGRGTGFGRDRTGWPGAFFEPVARQEPPGDDIDAVLEEEAVEDSVELAGVYIISVAARLLEMHPQTLRKYERVGLIRPSRTAGALRLYSDQDLARLKTVRRLVEELGLNLSGVRLLLDIIGRLHRAVDAVEGDQAAGQSAGGRDALAHMHAILEFLKA